MPGDRALRIGVDRERYRIARPHVVKFILLEVRRHPDLIRYKHGQAVAGLGELTSCGAQVGDTPRLGRRYCRVREIELRLVALGLGLREAGNSALALSLQRLDLPSCQLEGRLRAQKCSLLLMQLRGELLGVLNRAIACVLQVLEAIRLLLCEYQ